MKFNDPLLRRVSSELDVETSQHIETDADKLPDLGCYYI